MSGGIKSWPEGERPREKLLQQGASALSEAELLALILGSGDAGQRPQRARPGTGAPARVQVTALPGRRLLRRDAARQGGGTGQGDLHQGGARSRQARPGEVSRPIESFTRFTSASQVFEHLNYEFRDRRKEYFMALLLDGKNRIIKRAQISEGSLNQSIVHPREVFNVAVRESAAAMILLHNHPTGDPTPSPEDLEVTRRLCEAGQLMGIKVLDHIIIGDDAFYSFTERGHL